MKKLLFGSLFGLVLYACSMFDGRMIYDPDKLVDCHIGKYIFTIGQFECSTAQLELSVRRLLSGSLHISP